MMYQPDGIDGHVEWDVWTPDGSARMALTFSSELMENYATGRVIDGEGLQSVVTIRDVNGYPIIFSISTDGHLFGVLRQPASRSGWVQFNLSRGLGDHVKVQRVGVGQERGGHFTLVIAAASKNTPGASLIFTTASLSNDPDKIDWERFHELWHQRASRSNVKVTHLRVGLAQIEDEQQRPTGPLVLAATADGSGDHEFYRIDVDTSSDPKPWEKWDLAPQANEIIEIVIGRRRPGRTHAGHGVYVLSRQGEEVKLYFVMLPQSGHPSRNIRLPVPTGMRAMGVVNEPQPGDNQDSTGLYCAGEGIHYLSSAQLSARTPKLAEVMSSIAVSGLTGIVAREDEHHVALWALDGDENLHYTVGRAVEPPDGDTIDPGIGGDGADDEQVSEPVRSWEQILVVRRNVAHLAPIRNDHRETNDIVIVDTEHRLRHLTQENQTTVWLDKDIPVASTGHLQKFMCHATQLTLSKDGGTVRDQELQITASIWTEITVNGKVYWIDQTTPFKAKTDHRGTLTFLSKAESISPPIYRVSAAGMSRPRVVNPAVKIKAGLKRLESASGIENEKRQDGKPLVTRDLTPEERKKVAANITNFSAAEATLPEDGRLSNNYLEGLELDALGICRCWGMSCGEDARLRYAEGDAAVEMMQLSLAGVAAKGGVVAREDGQYIAIWAIAGNVIEWIKNAVSDTWAFIVQQVGHAWELIVTTAKEAFKFVIKCLGHIYEAVNWVLRKTLGIDLDDVMQWIGFLFDPAAVRTMQKVFRNVGEQAVAYMESKVGVARSQVNEAFQEFERDLHRLGEEDVAGKWGNNNLRNEHSGIRARVPERGRAVFDRATASPGGNFAAYQLNHGESIPMEGRLGEVDAAPFAEANLLLEFLENLGLLASGLVKTFQEMGEDVHAFFSRPDLTINSVIKKLVTIGATTFLQIARQLIDSILRQAELLLRGVRHYATLDLGIPFIKELYYLYMGERPEKVSVLDLVSLLFAMPATTIFKLATGRAPFAGGTGGLDTLKGEALFALFQARSAKGLDAATTQALRDYKFAARLGAAGCGAVSAVFFAIQAGAKVKYPGQIALAFGIFLIGCTVPQGPWTIGATINWISNIGLWLVGLWNLLSKSPLDDLISAGISAIIGVGLQVFKFAASGLVLIEVILRGGRGLVVAILGLLEQIGLFVMRLCMGVGRCLKPPWKWLLVIIGLISGGVSFVLQIAVAFYDYFGPMPLLDGDDDGRLLPLPAF